MKNKFTPLIVIAVSLLATQATAQTIPGSAFPAAGSVFVLTEADTTGVQAGAGGMGTTWNFSTLVNSSGSQIDSFMLPSATPYAALFPTADIAIHETAPPSTNYYIYLNHSIPNSNYQRVGNIQPDTVIYTDPANQYPYPLALSNSYNDTYYAHYHTTGGFASMAGVSSGSVDGTGTLVLPTGTYSNVVRTHFTRAEHDTVATHAVVVTIDYYEWYQANAYYPILSIVNTTIQSVVSIHKKTVAYRAGYASTGIADIANENNGVLLYPNPSTQKTTLLYESTTAGESLISIYDLSGRIVHSQVYSATGGLQQVALDITNVPVGIYEVKILNNEMAKTVRLSIER